MSKKNKQVDTTPKRSSQEITVEYNQMCANLGNALIQFEIVKSQAIAKFSELNEEIQKAVAWEEEKKKELDEKADHLIKMVGEKVVADIK